jgi:transcriptional regulator with XRE-family HTH domain
MNKCLDFLNNLLSSLHLFINQIMTELGEVLSKKSIKKAEVSRKTGISTSRLSQLSRNETTNLKADELYLIALAIDVPPAELLQKVCNHLKLKKGK